MERGSEDLREDGHCMRAATLIIVLAIHAMFLILFALSRGPARWIGGTDAPVTTWTFLPDGVKPVESMPTSPVAARAARAARRAAPVTAPTVRFAPEPT